MLTGGQQGWCLWRIMRFQFPKHLPCMFTCASLSPKDGPNRHFSFGFHHARFHVGQGVPGLLLAASPAVHPSPRLCSEPMAVTAWRAASPPSTGVMWNPKPCQSIPPLHQVTGEGEDKYLIATSEQPICAFHRNKWFAEKVLAIPSASHNPHPPPLLP